MSISSHPAYVIGSSQLQGGTATKRNEVFSEFLETSTYALGSLLSGGVMLDSPNLAGRKELCQHRNLFT